MASVGILCYLKCCVDKVSAEASLTVLAYNSKRVINILGVLALVRALA
jgi:hypothetical protein